MTRLDDCERQLIEAHEWDQRMRDMLVEVLRETLAFGANPGLIRGDGLGEDEWSCRYCDGPHVSDPRYFQHADGCVVPLAVERQRQEKERMYGGGEDTR